MSYMKLLVLGLCLSILLLGAAVVIFSPLRLFNALVPVDRGVERVAEGLAYGKDPRQMLDLYRPSKRGEGLPVLVFCYGGGWHSGDRTSYDFIGRSFAALGYLTVVLDYRLVPETRFPGFVEDTAAAIAWASENAASYGGDGSRVFLVGHSAGGYNVALVALDPRYLEAQGVDPRIIAGVATLAGPFDFLPLDDSSTIAAFGQAADAAATQPVNAVTASAPPFLLLTGDADKTVYPRNSKRLAAKLEAAGASPRLIEYPGLGHIGILLSLSRPFRWHAPVLADIRTFFEAIQASSKRS
jgi:acetyl esterase/lipase